MAKDFKFERLQIYREAVQFCVLIYQLSKKFPKEELYGLTSQIRRASISIVSNICEGSNRGKIEFKRYLDIARGSIFECVGQIKIAEALGLITKETHKEIYQQSTKLSKMIYNFKNSLK